MYYHYWKVYWCIEQWTVFVLRPLFGVSLIRGSTVEKEAGIVSVWEYSMYMYILCHSTALLYCGSGADSSVRQEECRSPQIYCPVQRWPLAPHTPSLRV